MKEEIIVNTKQWKKSNLYLTDYIFLQYIYNKEYTEAEFFIMGMWDILERKLRLDMLEMELYIKITGDNLEDIMPRQKMLDIFQTTDEVSLKVWIEEWCNLWPKGVKSGGYYIRSNSQDCLKKMIKFIKLRKYSKEVIMKATKNYIDRKARENYAYMMKAEYFIEKDGMSPLATEIENINEGGQDDWTRNVI